jgi:hypothetical protein
VPLDFFLGFITHALEHYNNKCGYKMQAIPSIGKGKHNNVVGTPNVSHNKITEKQVIPVRKVADTMLRRSDTGENVLRLLQIIQIYIHLISSQKVKKENFSVKSVLRGFPA